MIEQVNNNTASVYMRRLIFGSREKILCKIAQRAEVLAASGARGVFELRGIFSRKLLVQIKMEG